MGLTVHYWLRSATKSSERAQQIVGRMRQLALDLPFESVSDITHLEGAECQIDLATNRGSFVAFLVRQASIPIKVPWAIKRVQHAWGREQFCTRYLEAVPLEVFAFFAVPGPGSEFVGLGLARYPAEAVVIYDPVEDVRFLDDRLDFSVRKWRRHLARHGSPRGDDPADYVEERRIATRLPGWRWGSFCKTQYAADPKCGGPANFLRCHVGLVTLLDRIGELPGVRVYLNDEGKYGRHRHCDDSNAKKPAYCWSPGNYDPRALLAELGHWNEVVAAGVGALKDALGAGVAAPILSYPDFERLEFKGHNNGELDPFLKAMQDLAQQYRSP